MLSLAAIGFFRAPAALPLAGALRARVGCFYPCKNRDGGAPARDFGPIVGARDRAYLMAVRPGLPGGLFRDHPMPETVSAATPPYSRPLMVIAAVLGVLLAGTVALWAHYGTAVFYEMIVAGIAACL